MARILDACCGSRALWFDKENPDVIFMDNRKDEHTFCNDRVIRISPDVQADFRNIPYEDGTFSVVLFDPPHLLHAGADTWLRKKSGELPEEWRPYIKAGFDECMRVLKPDGILVFRWSEEQIRTKDVLEAVGQPPLFGDKKRKNRWLFFMKPANCEREADGMQPERKMWDCRLCGAGGISVDRRFCPSCLGRRPSAVR